MSTSINSAVGLLVCRDDGFDQPSDAKLCAVDRAIYPSRMGCRRRPVRRARARVRPYAVTASAISVPVRNEPRGCANGLHGTSLLRRWSSDATRVQGENVFMLARRPALYQTGIASTMSKPQLSQRSAREATSSPSWSMATGKSRYLLHQA